MTQGQRGDGITTGPRAHLHTLPKPTAAPTHASTNVQRDDQCSRFWDDAAGSCKKGIDEKLANFAQVLCSSNLLSMQSLHQSRNIIASFDIQFVCSCVWLARLWFDVAHQRWPGVHGVRWLRGSRVRIACWRTMRRHMWRRRQRPVWLTSGPLPMWHAISRHLWSRLPGAWMRGAILCWRWW